MAAGVARIASGVTTTFAPNVFENVNGVSPMVVRTIILRPHAGAKQIEDKRSCGGDLLPLVQELSVELDALHQEAMQSESQTHSVICDSAPFWNRNEPGSEVITCVPPGR